MENTTTTTPTEMTQQLFNRRPAYVRQLEEQLAAQGQRVQELALGIAELRRYLALDKFKVESWVSVQDVLNRLPDIFYEDIA